MSELLNCQTGHNDTGINNIILTGLKFVIPYQTIVTVLSLTNCIPSFLLLTFSFTLYIIIQYTLFIKENCV